jgi:hypothetical protein
MIFIKTNKSDFSDLKRSFPRKKKNCYAEIHREIAVCRLWAQMKNIKFCKTVLPEQGNGNPLRNDRFLFNENVVK